jgi:hypothetical protein
MIAKPTNSDAEDDNDSATSVAVLEADDGSSSAPDEWTGPRCEKCAAPLKSDVVTICRSCGWYVSLGTFVEIDQRWEVAVEPEEEPVGQPRPSHARVWFELVPWWGWLIIGSVLVVIVESVIARLVTPAGGSLRTTWSLAQLGIGVMTVILCHAFNFLVQVGDDADVGVLDLVLKPVKLWLKSFRRLPTRWWVTDALACGAVAIVMSVVVIGGIPYDRLWDWGFTPPAKQELMGAVMDRVKKVEGQSDNLEDSIGDFAGSAGVDENGQPINDTPPPPRPTADCVIIGYQLDKDGKISAYVLGTAHLGRLVYAGNVAPKFADDAEAGEMLARLAATKTRQRLLAIELEAVWVKPTITCRVTYESRLRTGRLTNIKWETDLGTMNASSKSQ